LPGAEPAITAPPFTLKTSPVMKLASGLQRKTMGAAISSGRAMRPSGIWPEIVCSIPGCETTGAVMSVPTHPGATQFT